MNHPTKNSIGLNPSSPRNHLAPESSAAKTGRSGKSPKAEVMSSLRNRDKTDSSNGMLHRDSPKINEYLKMISRFENKVKQDQIENADLEKVIKALEEKILSMNEPQKQKLKNIDFFKKRSIENLKTMKETLTNMFNDKLQRDRFFEFLKSPEFITVLLNEPDKANGYPPPKTVANPRSGEDFNIRNHPGQDRQNTKGG